MADITDLATSDTLSASRAIINTNFDGCQTLFAGSSAPASPVAYQPWIDTSGSPVVLKIRNAANSAWVTIIPNVAATAGALVPLTGATMTGDLSFGGTVKATNLAAPSAGGDAVNKTAADARLRSAVVPLGTISATDNKYLMIVGGTTTISDVLIVSETGVTSDAGNLWTFQVRNLTASVDLRSAVKSTNGAAITADTAYALGLNQNLTPSAGAVLQLQMAKTGSPNALTEALAVVRFTVAT